MGALIRNGFDDIADDQFCGCILVAPDWVLTAAHCVDDLELDEFLVAIGDEDLAAAPTIAGPKTIIVNPGRYHRTNRGGDIALVQLFSPVSGIEPVRYRRGDDVEALPESGRAIGWGLTQIGADQNYVPTSKLQFADVPIYEYLDPFIIENWRSEYLPEFIAAGALDPAKGTSSGDSGGPLLIPADDGENWMVAGIVSHGPSNTSDLAAFSMFTDVAVYSDWIDQIIGYGKENGTGFEAWGFDTGIFEEIGDNGLPVGRVWPFGSGNARSLRFSSDLRNWQEFEFDIRSFGSYRWNEDGSVTLFPEDWIGDGNSLFVQYEETDQPVSGSGPIPLYPYQVSRGLSSGLNKGIFGQDHTLYKMENLVPGKSYHLYVDRSDLFHFSFDFYEKVGDEYHVVGVGLRDIGRYAIPFAAESGSEYWVAISAYEEGYGYEMYLQELVREMVGPDEWHEGQLSEDDSMYRRSGVVMDTYGASVLISGDVKIELESEFDAEMGIYERVTGKQIGYFDYGAENDRETFIAYGEDLRDEQFRIFNFDHGVYGTYRFRYTSFDESSTVDVGVDEQRSVTKSDRVSSENSEGEVRYFEFIEINQPSEYSSINVTIDASLALLSTGIWDYNADGYLENDFGDTATFTFVPEPENRYFIYVSSLRGERNVNYTLKVQGVAIDDDFDDGNPIDESGEGREQEGRSNRLARGEYSNYESDS